MAIEPATGHDVRADFARLVKVENLGDEEYIEDFKGQIWRIPARGFILKPIMEAHRFKSQFKAPLVPDGNSWKVVTTKPKPIRVTELTPEEREKVEHVTPAQQKKAEEAVDQKTRLTCMKCGFVAASDKGLAIHSKAIHPENVVE